MKLSHGIARIAVCVVLAIPMYCMENIEGSHERMGTVGFIAGLAVYWTFQAARRFKNPLDGGLAAMVLELIYWMAMPGWVRA